jgi:hypothetical protein
MSFIGNKQKQIRQIGEKLKKGAEIGFKVGRGAGRAIQTGTGQLETLRRQAANTAGMIDRNASKILPLTSLTPLGSVPGYNQAAALGLAGIKAGRAALQSSDAKNLIQDVGKVGRGIERQSVRQLDNLKELPSDLCK